MVGSALFGCGRIGKVHAESIAAHPRAGLVWICDPMEAAARSLAGQYGATAGPDAGPRRRCGEHDRGAPVTMPATGIGLTSLSWTAPP